MGAADDLSSAVSRLSRLLQNTNLQQLLDENERLRQTMAYTIAEIAAKLSRYDTAMLIIGARTERKRHFVGYPGLFGEPAWDILLDLYGAYYREEAVSVSSAVIASNVAATTGLRWVSFLEQCKLIERRSDPLDKRRSFLALSEEGVGQVEAYLDGYGNWIIRQHRGKAMPPAPDQSPPMR